MTEEPGFERLLKNEPRKVLCIKPLSFALRYGDVARIKPSSRPNCWGRVPNMGCQSLGQDSHAIRTPQKTLTRPNLDDHPLLGILLLAFRSTDSSPATSGGGSVDLVHGVHDGLVQANPWKESAQRNAFSWS